MTDQGNSPKSSFLHDWRPPDELDAIPLDTAEIERMRAKAWMGLAHGLEAKLREALQCLDLHTSPQRRILRCPRCGSEYLHHYTVLVLNRISEDGPGVLTRIHPDGKLTQHPLSSESEEWSGRRDEVRIEFKCEECERETDLYIVQHKGSTYLSANTGQILGLPELERTRR